MVTINLTTEQVEVVAMCLKRQMAQELEYMMFLLGVLRLDKQEAINKLSEHFSSYMIILIQLEPEFNLESWIADLKLS